MAKTIVIANQKGGVAKTTTAAALAAGLKKRGFTVLAIDTDPQGNLSEYSNTKTAGAFTIYEVMLKKIIAKEAIQRMDIYDIIPANNFLSGIDINLTSLGKEYRLKETIKPILDEYDYIIIDTPPALGNLTINAFTAADEIIIPTTADTFATSGIIQLYESMDSVKEYSNKNLKIAGILITKYNPRLIVYKDIKELIGTIANRINAKVYTTFISNSIIVVEAQASKVDLYSYDKHNTVTMDYEKFIDEFLGGIANDF